MAGRPLRARMILIGLAAAAMAAFGAGHNAQAGPAADAEAAFQKDDMEHAFALYTRAVEDAGPDNNARAAALFDRAEAYVRIGKDTEALADYAEAMRLSPDPAFKALILAGCGDLYTQERKFPDAVTQYTAALAMKPDMVGVLTARAQARSRLKDDAGALADYEAELKLNPKYPRALRGRALLLGQPDPTQVKENPW